MFRYKLFSSVTSSSTYFGVALNSIDNYKAKYQYLNSQGTDHSNHK